MMSFFESANKPRMNVTIINNDPAPPGSGTKDGDGTKSEPNPQSTEARIPASMFSDQLLAELSAKPIVEFHILNPHTPFQAGYWVNGDLEIPSTRNENQPEDHNESGNENLAQEGPEVHPPEVETFGLQAGNGLLNGNQEFEAGTATRRDSLSDLGTGVAPPLPILTYAQVVRQVKILPRKESGPPPAPSGSGGKFRQCELCWEQRECRQTSGSDGLHLGNTGIVICPAQRKYECEECGGTGEIEFNDDTDCLPNPTLGQKPDSSRTQRQFDETGNKKGFNKRTSRRRR